MNRRTFIYSTSLSVGSVLGCSRLGFFHSKSTWHRCMVTSVTYQPIELPEGKRLPLGWEAFQISAHAQNEPIVLHFSNINRYQTNIWLRITDAIDFREEVEIRAYLPESGETIGFFDIRY